MSKVCLACKTENHSAANHCSYCGSELPDKEITDEIKLRLELHEANITIQNLNKALAETSNNKYYTEEAQKTINDYKNKNESYIKENAVITKQLSESNNRIISIQKLLKTTKIDKNRWIRALIAVCVLLIIVALCLYHTSGNKSIITYYLTNRNNVLQKNYSLDSANRVLNTKMELVSSNFPIIIKSLKVGNLYHNFKKETDFGNTIYSSNSMYLVPQIEYIGLKDTAINLNVRLFQQKTIIRGKNSPNNYTFSDKINITDKGIEDLKGWGGEKKGYWKAGSYRYEIWYNNVCLKATDFKIY